MSCSTNRRDSSSMPFAPALEHAGEAAGLALEVEAQRQAMHVREGLERELPDGVHRDLGEEPVANLAQHRHRDPRQAVEHGQAGSAPPSQAGSPRLALPLTATSASVAHLKVKGVATVTSFATRSSPKA